MKIYALIASAVILSSPATARDPSPTEMFIDFVVLAPIVSKCGTATIIPGGALKYAKSHGINFEVVGEAAGNAVLSIVDRPYDKTKLIPAVTAYVKQSSDFVASEYMRLGAKGFCDRYGKILVGAGIMK